MSEVCNARRGGNRIRRKHYHAESGRYGERRMINRTYSWAIVALVMCFPPRRFAADLGLITVPSNTRQKRPSTNLRERSGRIPIKDGRFSPKLIMLLRHNRTGWNCVPGP